MASRSLFASSSALAARHLNVSSASMRICAPASAHRSFHHASVHAFQGISSHILHIHHAASLSATAGAPTVPSYAPAQGAVASLFLSVMNESSTLLDLEFERHRNDPTGPSPSRDHTVSRDPLDCPSAPRNVYPITQPPPGVAGVHNGKYKVEEPSNSFAKEDPLSENAVPIEGPGSEQSMEKGEIRCNSVKDDKKNRKEAFHLITRNKKKFCHRMDRMRYTQRLAFAFQGIDYFQMRNLSHGEVVLPGKTIKKRDIFFPMHNYRPPFNNPFKPDLWVPTNRTHRGND